MPRGSFTARIAPAALTALFAIMPFATVHAAAATLSFDPPAHDVGVGDTIVLNVRLNTQGTCVNAANVTVAFDPGLVPIQANEGNSILTLWIEHPTVNSDNTVSFLGGIPGGYCGRIIGDPELSNLLARVVVRVDDLPATDSFVRFASTTALYANDGHGSPVPLTLGSADLHRVKTPATPRNEWLPFIQQDSTPPAPFQIQLLREPGLYGGKFFLLFSTFDVDSGIDHYELFDPLKAGTIDQATASGSSDGWTRIESPYVIPDASVAGKKFIVRAIDLAGNAEYAEYDVPANAPTANLGGDALVIVGMLVLIALVTFVMRRWFPHHRSVRPPVPGAGTVPQSLMVPTSPSAPPPPPTPPAQ